MLIESVAQRRIIVVRGKHYEHKRAGKNYKKAA